ncbi:hypothetical protein EVAR_67404_1 [Eumeta japonica]|uniref:Uncharacterized protein n=1 Tax=Eumeta variegata TaxID=151549 RepID=A0A4C2A198_EUMVA|nr:hypothetical protein EVAR_67404_1 [Eumeta japonica]
MSLDLSAALCLFPFATRFELYSDGLESRIVLSHNKTPTMKEHDFLMSRIAESRTELLARSRVMQQAFIKIQGRPGALCGGSQVVALPQSAGSQHLLQTSRL